MNKNYIDNFLAALPPDLIKQYTNQDGTLRLYDLLTFFANCADDLNVLIEKNQRILFILGVATSLVMELKDHIPANKKENYEWLLHAVENVVYKNKPMPPFPDN